jgi:streptogramin lyase
MRTTTPALVRIPFSTPGLIKKISTICLKSGLAYLFLLLGLLSTAAQSSFAQANALNFGNNFFVTGDYVVAGAQGMNVTLPGGIAVGKISLPDANPGITGMKSVPQGAQIISALLYWQTIEEPGELGAGQNGFFQPVFKGGPLIPYAIAGVSLGTQTFNAGGCTTNVASGKVLRSYRAEVRGYLPQDAQGNVLANTDATGFNGYYQVALPSNDDSTPLGATLVIIYRVLSPNFPLKSIVIYEGDFAPSSASLTMTQTVQGFYDAAQNPVTRLTHIVGLGKSNKPETVYLDNTMLPSLYPHGQPPFPGYYGAWDNPTWTLDPNETYVTVRNPLAAGGAASATTEVVASQQGCVSSAAVIISITVDSPDNDGLLRSWKTNQGYCDVSINGGVCNQGSNSDPGWVALPGATLNEKDVFIQLDYMCNSPIGPDSCNISNPNNPFGPPNYSFDPRLETDPNTGKNAVQEVIDAYSKNGIVLHVNPPGTIQNVHAMPEPTCTDNPGAKPPEFCAFPSQPPYGVPGVVGWKAGFTFIKNQYVDSTGSVSNCPTTTTAGCAARFQHGRKDSWHYVLSGHALGRTQWSLLAKTLIGAAQVGNTVVFATSTPHGLAPDPNDSGILNGRVTVVSAITNPTLNGTYLVQSVPTPTTFTIHVANPGLGAYFYSTDPNLAVASGQSSLASGFSDIGGADSLISLGSWNPVPAQEVTGSTFMHELGHANGLTHGGIFFDHLVQNPNDYRPTIEANAKPNFQSVMSYPFQLSLLDPGSGLPPVLDYSVQQLDPLNENSLPAGVTIGNSSPAYPVTIWYTPIKPLGNVSAAKLHSDGTPLALSDPPMYRVEGSANPIGGAPGSLAALAAPAWTVGGSIDVNFDGTVNEADTIMRGYNDWANIDLRQVSSANDTFGGVGSLPPGGGALPPGGGALPPGGGALPPGGGALPPGGGALPPGGGALPPGGGALPPGGGVGEEINVATASAVTASPTHLTATEDSSPRLVHLSWRAPFGLIGSYNIYRSADGGKTFTVIASVSGAEGGPPPTMYTDTVTCSTPTGFQYFVTAVQSAASANPGQESAPSNIVSIGQDSTLTGCYIVTGPSAPAGAVHGAVVPITWTLKDDFNSPNFAVNNPAANTLVVNGPLPNNCGTAGPTNILKNGQLTPQSGAKSTFPPPSAGQYTFNWDTDGFCAGQYTVQLILDSTQAQSTLLKLAIDVSNTDSTPNVTTTFLPAAIVGRNYSYTLSQDGGTGPFTWTVSGAPPNIVVDPASGTLSGAPTTVGTYPFTAMVKDSLGNTGTQMLTLTVLSAPNLPVLNYGQLQPTTSPGTRCCVAMAFDPVSKSTLLFGGVLAPPSANYIQEGDTWQLQNGQWTQLSPSPAPPARSGAAMVYDAATNTIVLFGGNYGSHDFNDTWIWNGSTGTWTQAIADGAAGSPLGRRFDSQGMAYDPNTQTVVMFGGIDHTNAVFYNDTWVWNGTAWTQMTADTSPSPRRTVLATDPSGNVMLFGGGGSSGALADTWQWNGTNWNQQSPAASPAARDLHNMVFDPDLNRVVLFGGGGPAFYSDTWSWDGLTWTQVIPSAVPHDRYAFGMDYDGAAKAVVLFGGFSSSPALGDTWELAPPCTTTPPGLVSWYPFNGNALDIRGGKPGTVVGSGSQFVPAEVGQGFKPGPQGSGGIVVVSDSPTLVLSQFTIGAWVRVDNIDNVETMQIVWKGSGTADVSTPYSLSVEGSQSAGPGKLLAIITNGSSEQLVSSSATLSTGTFHYVALTADGATVKLYVDGQLDTSTQQNVQTFTSTNPLQVGGIQGGLAPGNNFDGVIDELQIWNRALSATEVSGIFNASTAGECQNLWFTETNGTTNRIGVMTPNGNKSNEYVTTPTAASFPSSIVAGPDGNLWFTENTPNNIGVVTPGGAFTEYPIMYPAGYGSSNLYGAYGITSGPDGNLWFTEANSPEDASFVGSISPTGTINTYQIGFTAAPHGIAAGPDGNLWFAESGNNRIGRITPGAPNTVTHFPTPTSPSGPEGITAGPDGNLWFTEATANKIGMISPTGTVTEFPVPTNSAGLIGIATGPDGNLWFAESNVNQISRITPTGTVTEFTVPGTPKLITAGPDGNLWFTDFGTGKIGKITTSGVVTEFPVTTASSGPLGITLGP